MHLFIDFASHLSLKPLLAQEISQIDGVNITNKKINLRPYSELTSPPLLELDDGSCLFSGNVIASFLMLRGNHSLDHPQVDSWLEWESTYFQPYAHRVLSSTYHNVKIDQFIMERFVNCLKKLDAAMSGKRFLYHDQLTAADVVIWCALYPLVADKRNCSLYLQNFSNIVKWFDNLAVEEPFQKIVDDLFKGKGSDICKKSIMSLPYQPLPRGIAENGPECKGESTEHFDQTDDDQDINITPQDVADAYQSWLHGRRNAPPPREILHPLLPQEGVKNILITSALPYVNNVPHLGNIIGCVLSADVFARYCRLRNYNTLYICGTDEYGTATETKAIEEGLTPREICDKYHKLHSDIYQWFQISFDYFGRTTTQQQTQIAQDIFWRLHERGFLLEKTTNQLMCEKCDRFLADRFVEGICPYCGCCDARGDQCDACGKLINAVELKEPRCKLCQMTPTLKMSNHLFLDLPKLELQLTAWFEKSSESGLWTANAKTITHSWIRDGLKPRCITRDLKWGTPVPLDGFTDKVFYVWYDAPIGYLSITANYTDEWERWWRNPSQVQLYQFMAKDNVPFHGVIFPSIELGADNQYTIANHIVSTEYLNYEDGKFSKSRGVGVFGDQAKEIGIPADIWRFYLLYTRPETQDSAFCWTDLMTKNNSELLNNFGNFVNRGLTFIVNNFGGEIPEMNLDDEDKMFIAYLTYQLNCYLDLLEKVKLRDAIRHILNISRRGNQYIQSNKPWVMIKGSSVEKARAGSIVGLCANVTCLLSVMIQPYMPLISSTIQQQLAAPVECNVLLTRFVCYLPTGHQIGKPSPLFVKLDAERMAELKRQYAGSPSSKETTPPFPAERKIDGSVLPQENAVTTDSTLSAEELEEMVAAQAKLVRAMKTAKVEKKQIDAEVGKLLSLKKQFSIASGRDPQLSNTISEKQKK